MLTLTSEYALRAMVHLARRHNGDSVTGKQLARQTGVPSKYLSKILADLVRCGVLAATRGKTGGFRLTRDPQSIPLKEVLTPFEPTFSGRRPCPFGNLVCNDDEPCGGHEHWKKVKTAYEEFFTKTSVSDIAEPKRVALRRAPKKRKHK